MEVIGEWPFRTKVKRRKACASGELACGSEAQTPPKDACVVATGWSQSLLVLPEEFCRAPHKR